MHIWDVCLVDMLVLHFLLVEFLVFFFFYLLGHVVYRDSVLFFLSDLIIFISLFCPILHLGHGVTMTNNIIFPAVT